LGWRALALHEQGQYAEAAQVQERALALCRKLYPPAKYPEGHPNLANSLNTLGYLFQERGEYARAERYQREALAMNRKLYPPAKYPNGHTDLASSLNNLALLFLHQGEAGQAERYLREALNVNRKLYPPAKYPNGHPHLAISLNHLGVVLQEQGDYERAERCYRDGLAMARKLYPRNKFPNGHPNLLQCLHCLSALFHNQGNYGRAEDTLREVLAMCRKLFPEDAYPDGHPYLASSLGELGPLLQDRGDYVGAERYCRETQAMLRKLYPKAKYPAGHPDLATSLNSLSDLLRARGEYGEAERYARAALAMRRTLYPKAQYPAGHVELAASLNNLANLLKRRGEYGRAEPFVREALAMFRTLYPPDKYPRGHADLATCLETWCGLLQAGGDYAQAERHAREAVAIRRKLYPKAKYPQGHPLLAMSLGNLGLHLYDRRDYDGAERHAREAMTMLRTLYSPDKYPKGHPHLALSLSNLGDLLWARGDYRGAEHCLREALGMHQGLAGVFAEAASEATALNYVASLPRPQHDFLAITARHAQASAKDDYPLLWGSKGTVLRILEGRYRLLRGLTDKGSRQKAEQLLGMRQELARLLYASGADKSPAHSRKLRYFTEQKERLETELAQRIPDLAGRQSRRVTPPIELAKALPPRSVFIDLYRYRTPDFQRKESVKPFYTAFVLARGAPVRRVELGEAVPIEEALAAWRKDIAGDRGSVAAERLRRLVWEPLEKQLPAGTDTIYLCPDGPLSRLPWAALPGTKKGAILLEDYALALVPHGPFLFDQLHRQDKTPRTGLLLALGGVAYDRDPDGLRPQKDEPRAQSPARGRKSGPWPELPGSARELDQMVALAKGLDRPPRVLPLRGTAAGTAQVLAGLPKARWAHLATHGFFAASDSAVRTHLLREADFLRGVGAERVGAGARNPLTQTGLVLAGANRPARRESDHGILTAEAVVGLDLSGLELAVLSACETGLGEAQAGEGVFGLQRAFHLAGTKNVVASLWKVDDQATAALMAVFYHQLWVKKRPPIQALRDAQLALYRNPMAAPLLAQGRSAPDFDKTVRRVTRVKSAAKTPRAGRPPVKHWAAFVLSGAGR
jgi:CHAT domain-containing protein/tetratricopeptide (TPR) repeat protein